MEANSKLMLEDMSFVLNRSKETMEDYNRTKDIFHAKRCAYLMNCATMLIKIYFKEQTNEINRRAI